MSQRLYAIYAAVILSLLPAAAWASEREAFNPPGWVGWLAVIVALALPLIVRAYFFRNK